MMTGVKMPSALTGTVAALGNCNTALSMMVIGMILAEINWKEFGDWTIFRYAILCLVIIPEIIYIFVYCFLPNSKTVFGIRVLLAAMPAGATTSILADKYETEPEFATKMVILSTLLPLPTIFIWGMILPH